MCCFSKENGLPALLPAVPPAVPFPGLFSALSPALLGIWASSVLWQAVRIPSPGKEGDSRMTPKSFLSQFPWACNLCGQKQRCQMPDIENSRKGRRVGHGKTAEKQPEKQHPKNSQNSCFSGVSGVFPAVFRLFYRDPFSTLFGCFSAIFNVGHLAPL